MDTKKLGQTIFVATGLVGGVIAAIVILLNPTGGIAGLSKLTTLVGIMIGLVNPRAALFYLAGQAIYSDEFKRIGVYYGVESDKTVSEILVGPLLTLCAINFSFLYGILQGRYRLGTLGWILYGLIPIIAIGMLAGNADQGTLSLRLYLAGTTCLYMTLMPVCYGLFKTMEEWVKFISIQVLLAAPAAAWGIWQYKNGFNQIEWTYALSNLSRVHSSQMLSFVNPRVFGLFGSASAYGCISLYGTFSIWRGLRYKQFRWLFLALGIMYFVCMVVSEQRTALVYPFIVLVFIYFFRTPLRTFVVYSTAFLIITVSIINADYLLNTGIDNINEAISVDSDWGQSVLKVSTFSDRLRGWQRLNKAETWSLFGTGKTQSDAPKSVDVGAEDYNHDIINKVLINYGAIGLFAGLALVGYIVVQLHLVIARCKDKSLRNDGAFAMACIIPTLILSAIGGDNYTTTPMNLQIWSIFVGIFVLKRIVDTHNSGLHKAEAAHSDS